MLCNNCDQENSSDAGFCSKCGYQLSNTQAQTPPPLTAINISKDAQSPQNIVSSDSETADSLLAAFVGEKYDSFYRGKWFKDSEPRLDVNNDGSSIHSFNAAGFFFGVFWLCYRKMYKLAFLIMLAITVIDFILMQVLGADSYNGSINYIYMGIWIGLTGFLGNYFYFDTSVKEIKKITESTTDLETAKQQLTEKGGVSWVGAIVGGIVLLVLSAAATYFFAPDWYWLA